MDEQLPSRDAQANTRRRESAWLATIALVVAIVGVLSLRYGTAMGIAAIILALIPLWKRTALARTVVALLLGGLAIYIDQTTCKYCFTHARQMQWGMRSSGRHPSPQTSPQEPAEARPTGP